jgi:hypothetical protein
MKVFTCLIVVERFHGCHPPLLLLLFGEGCERGMGVSEGEDEPEEDE